MCAWVATPLWKKQNKTNKKGKKVVPAPPLFWKSMDQSHLIHVNQWTACSEENSSISLPHVYLRFKNFRFVPKFNVMVSYF
jgi:hypothetical protein